MSSTKKECEQETKIRKAIQYLAIAENYLDNVSREYEIPNCTFLNQAFKEVQQFRMELFCFLGEFDWFIKRTRHTAKPTTMRSAVRRCSSNETECCGGL